MVVPEDVKKLVEAFTIQYASYKSSSYTETPLRREFLDPFFTALGWDVANKEKLPELYKDVVHEDSIKIGGFAKAPDYSFRIGGVRKFFVEAKKPSENLYENPRHAFQLRRYAWSAKLPISILTDFEEFVVYDTRHRPYESDSSNKYRIFYCKYTEIVERWDEISELFSKKAVQDGSLDAYAELVTTKRGVEEVDDEFLKEIEKWRELLAKDLAKNNIELSTRELNFAVQKTIDRIIFLRISEDRGIEQYGRLMALLTRPNIYKNLCVLFEEADQKYNSGLFHFKQSENENESPDTWTLKLDIGDKSLSDILKSIYPPESPYEFSVLPADILGHVYEQFLGKVIRLTDSHNAVIEDKPEVKKAGGVFYTPTYIVTHIVENTVGKLVKGKTPKQLEKLSVLDPACGSGSFLLGAYDYLLNWHTNYYERNMSEKLYKGKNPVIFQSRGGEWRLTTAEKKRILLNNIYGVDIDTQAVEVTKLSLLLRVLEGENQETLQKQLGLFHERALPDLGNNIKCGNSLISTDFFSENQLIFFSDMQYRINAFNWDAEFQNIMESGGFSAVIGNPPYVFGGNYGIENIEKKYFKTKFKSGAGKINLFTLLIEKSLSLLSTGGFLSFIIPNTFLRVTSYEPTRKYVLNNSHIKEIIDLGNDVFKTAVTSSIVITLEKQTKKNNDNIIIAKTNINGEVIKIKQSEFDKGSYIFNTGNNQTEFQLLNKLRAESIELGILCKELIFGVVITKNRDELVSTIQKKGFKPFLEGKDIGRYSIRVIEKYIDYEPRKLHRPRTPDIFEAKEKLLIQRITGGNKPLKVAYDNKQYYNKESINNLILKDDSKYNIKYVLGLLNSNLINWFYSNQFTNASRLTVNISKEYLSQIPIKAIDFNSNDEVKMYNTVISYVNELLELYSKRDIIYNQDREITLRQIESLEDLLNNSIYNLYNLSEEEIKIINGSV